MSVENTEAPSPQAERSATYLAKDESTMSFPPTRTALLIIDPVNDFLSEGGADWEMTKSTVQMNDVIGHLKLAIEGARARHRRPVWSDGLYRGGLCKRAATPP